MLAGAAGEGIKLMAKTVLVLGGGIGGVVAARELRKWLGSSDRVILIDKDGKHLFALVFECFGHIAHVAAQPSNTNGPN